MVLACYMVCSVPEEPDSPRRSEPNSPRRPPRKGGALGKLQAVVGKLRRNQRGALVPAGDPQLLPGGGAARALTLDGDFFMIG